MIIKRYAFKPLLTFMGLSPTCQLGLDAAFEVVAF
jgi:hypothetical protein